MRNQPIVQRGLRLASSFFLWLVALGTTATLGQNPSPYSTPPLPLPFQDALADGRACPDCPSMILLQPASFVMGAMPGVGLNNERTDKNHPIPVEIPKPFAMSIQEVTRSEFAAFIAANPQQETPGPCAGLFDGAFEKRDNADWKSPVFNKPKIIQRFAFPGIRQKPIPSGSAALPDRPIVCQPKRNGSLQHARGAPVNTGGESIWQPVKPTASATNAENASPIRPPPKRWSPILLAFSTWRAMSGSGRKIVMSPISTQKSPAISQPQQPGRKIAKESSGAAPGATTPGFCGPVSVKAGSRASG